MKYQCEKHMWNCPAELAGMFGDERDERCPVCLREENMHLAIESAKTTGDWGRAEGAQQKYVDSMDQARRNVSGNQRNEFDKRTVTDLLKRWGQFG